jgi:hypothetical protein
VLRMDCLCNLLEFLTSHSEPTFPTARALLRILRGL